MHVEDLNGWGFVHTLQGSGPRRELTAFLQAVVHACEGTVLCLTVEDEAKKRFYSRLGFRATGERFGPHEVLVRFPVKEVNA